MSFLAVVHLLALLMFAGWLWHTDRLDGQRLGQLRSLFAPTIAEAQTAAEQASLDAEARRQQQEEQVRRQDPPLPAAEFSATRRNPWPGWERLPPLVEEYLPGRDLHVLDVGCGPGDLAHLLLADQPAGQGAQTAYLGTDVSAAQIALARAYRGRGRYHESIAELEKTIRLHPHATEAYWELAISDDAAGLLDEAEKSLRQAINIRPDYWRYWDRLGEILFRNVQPGRCDFSPAREAFERAVELG